MSATVNADQFASYFSQPPPATSTGGDSSKSGGKSGADKLSELSLPSSSEQHVGTQIVGAIIHDDDDDIGDTAKWDTAKVSISN